MRVLRYRSKLASSRRSEDVAGCGSPGASLSIAASLRGRTREIPLDDPERPIEEPASPDALADATLHGSSTRCGTGENDRDIARQAARTARLVDGRRDVSRGGCVNSWNQGISRALSRVPRSTDLEGKVATSDPKVTVTNMSGSKIRAIERRTRVHRMNSTAFLTAPWRNTPTVAAEVGAGRDEFWRTFKPNGRRLPRVCGGIGSVSGSGSVLLPPFGFRGNSRRRKIRRSRTTQRSGPSREYRNEKWRDRREYSVTPRRLEPATEEPPSAGRAQSGGESQT